MGMVRHTTNQQTETDRVINRLTDRQRNTTTVMPKVSTRLLSLVLVLFYDDAKSDTQYALCIYLGRVSCKNMENGWMGRGTGVEEVKEETNTGRGGRLQV